MFDGVEDLLVDVKAILQPLTFGSTSLLLQRPQLVGDSAIPWAWWPAGDLTTYLCLVDILEIT